MLVTTDGTIADIPRENYVPAEERVAKELREAGKPFAVILNSAAPESAEAHKLAEELEEKYKAPVALVDCTKLNANDVEAILDLVVGEFPIRELCFTVPEWCSLLPDEHNVKLDIMEKIDAFSCSVKKLGDVMRTAKLHTDMSIVGLDAGTGKGEIAIPVSKDVYYATLSEMTGLMLDGEEALFSALMEMSKVKNEYDKIKDALSDARNVGYGIVMPSSDEFTISEPVMVKQGTGWGIKVGAMAESIHMIKTFIKTDVCPTFGTEEQTSEVIKQMRSEYEENPAALLDTKMFGRSLSDLVNDGMYTNLTHLPEDARAKMGQTIEKIINEGASGLICILL